MKYLLTSLAAAALLASAPARAADPSEPGPPADAPGESASPTQPASSMQEAPTVAPEPAPRKAPARETIRKPRSPGLIDRILGGYTEDKANVLKIGLAVALIALLSWGVVLEERGRGRHRRRERRFAIALLGILGVLGWFNYGKFHAGTFVHVWEHYHYYVGAKYFPELRYARLYECSAIAETELGRRDLVAKRMMRDIAATNLIGTTEAILADPDRCKRHFTEARWQQFKTDVQFFIGRMGNSQWERSQKDHGFNGTPWWSIAGTSFANAIGPASNATMNTLALLDPVLIVLMFGFVWWAFGIEIFAVAATFFAVNFPSRYWWNGGAFLRYDYLAAAVIGICLLRKQRFVAGGALLAYTASLRLFPLMFAVGPAVHGFWRFYKEKKFPVEHRRILLGAALATVILVPASMVVGKGGGDIFREFTQNTLKHSETPLTNHMGLRTVMSWRMGFDLSDGFKLTFDNARYLKDPRLDDPFKTWKEVRLANFRQLLPLFVLANLVLIWGIWRVTRDEPVWMAAALSGVVLIATASELTCYYYAFMIPGAFLMEKRKDYGMWLVLLAIGTHAITRFQIWDDDKYVLMSAASVAFGAGVIATMYRELRARELQPAPVETPAEPGEGKRSKKKRAAG